MFGDGQEEIERMRRRMDTLTRQATVSEGALDELIESLDEPDALVVGAACDALGQLGARASRAIEPIMEGILRWPQPLKPQGIRALGMIAPARFGILWQLTRLVEDGSYEVLDTDALRRWAAAEPLAARAVSAILMPKMEVDVEEDYFYLEPFVDNGAEARRSMYQEQLAAATVLVALGSRSDTTARSLIRLYDAGVVQERCLVIQLWGGLGPCGHVAIKRIAAAFGETDPALRAACLNAIFAMDAPWEVALPMLLEGLTSSQRPLRLAALSLRECLNARRGEALRLFLTWVQEPSKPTIQRGMALRLIEELGDGSADVIARIEPLLHEPSLALRRQATRSLRQLGHEPEILAADAYRNLHNAKESLRLRAAEALLQCDAHIAEVYDALWSVLQAQRSRYEKATQRRYDKGVASALKAMTHTASLFVAELRSGGLARPEAAGLRVQLLSLVSFMRAELQAQQSAAPEATAAVAVFDELDDLLQDEEQRARWRGLWEEALF